jgi:hypothetical protein
MKPITLFSWGYYGWGNSTKQLIKAVDAVEQARRFEPPFFVDIRLQREVRAEGFKGDRFRSKIGDERYDWMKSLGNQAIASKSDRMKIADPKTSADLLLIAQNAAKHKQRILFFCSCKRPKNNTHGVTCHRTEVTRLLLGVAKKEGISIEVVEWPGGTPKARGMDISSDVQRPVALGRKAIALKRTAQLSKFAGLPWGTVVSFEANDELIHRISGPAFYHARKWCLPVIDGLADSDATFQEYQQASSAARTKYGYNPRFSF